MAKSTRVTYTAADRFERRRLTRPTIRRAGTRSAVVALAMREG